MIKRGEKVVAVGTSQKSNLYLLDMQPTRLKMTKTVVRSSMPNLAKTIAQSMAVWHQRLGHVSCDRIRKMGTANMVNGLAIIESRGQDHFCQGCTYGKHHRLPFPIGGRTRAKKTGELIHADVCGSMSTPSPSGARYFVLFTDDYSGYSVIIFIKEKSEVAEHFQKYVQRVEIEIGNCVNTLRSDNGGEFIGREFTEWMKKKGIRHETSAPTHLSKTWFLSGKIDLWWSQLVVC